MSISDIEKWYAALLKDEHSPMENKNLDKEELVLAEVNELIEDYGYEFIEWAMRELKEDHAQASDD